MKKSESHIDNINHDLWQKRFTDSRTIEKEASENLKRAEKAGYQRGIAYANMNIAVLSFYRSKNENALKHLSPAYRWLEANKNEKGYPRALILKGNIFESFGEYEKALNLWLEACKTSREINDIESEGEACSQLGLIYSRLGNLPKALEYFEKGLKIREEMGDILAVASSLNRIGMALRQMKRFDESLDYYFQSLEIRKEKGQTGAIPWTLLGIASTYEEMENFEESLKHYEMGMTGSDKRCALQCMMGAGRIYSRTGETAQAEEKLENALKMAREFKSLALIADAYAALAANHELLGKHNKALKNFKQYIKVKESYQSNEVQNKISNIEVAHAIERSEQEKEIYRLKHVELKKAYDIIEENHREITASINYASRIQKAILPDPREIPWLAKNSFFMYLPRDIVSGDFYWFTELNNNKLILVAADCTGHGVPGSLMSMLGISFLEEIINKREITEPGYILDELRKEVQRALHQKGEREEARDGMDISLCVIDRSNKTIQYSGAYNNLYLIRNDELIEYHADRMPIGIYDLGDKNFSSHDIPYLSADIIYMYSDGYSDQFGGQESKKLKSAALKRLLLEIHKQPIKQQKLKLESEFFRWKGKNPQTDDVLIVGLKL
jgi:serine phosphatase RsbU (regulator of sigma subunit)